MSEVDTTIVFSEFQQPGLRDDTYTITAQVTLNTKDPGAPTFAKVEQVIQVGTSAESIPADSVEAVFPPDGESGHFTGHLPHILLNHASLPWHKQMPNGLDSTPWLALLLITDEELRGPNVTVSSTPPKTLTLKTPFFRSIAPTLADLTYLAHVRRVDTISKADSSETIRDFALVVGSRLPAASTGSNVFLVPLHDHADYLPGGSSDPGDEVGLPILYAWRFFTQPDEKTFGAVVSAVNVSPNATLRLPDDGPGNLLAMGYVPMPHSLRVGGQTVSWYRGPFLPYRSNRQLPRVPIRNADEITFYDPAVGMMEVSCSAAWTLGRMMALNAGSFASALYKWKRGVQRTTLDQLIHEWDTGELPSPSLSAGKARRSAAESALSQLLPAALAELGGHAAVARSRRPSLLAKAVQHVRTRRARLHQLSEGMTDAGKIAAMHRIDVRPRALALFDTSAAATDDGGGAIDPTKDPQVTQIWSWLGDLLLLKGVPLSYLVPHEHMLPSESIRFFHVDQSWLTALIDGALSIGRVTESDQAHDAAFQPMWHTAAGKVAASARLRRMGMLDVPANQYPLPPARPVSGLFLRSTAVTSWPGLQIEATGPSGDANILRMESFDTLLICLFDRDVNTVKVHAPPEGVHFGFEEDTHLNLTKTLRYASGPNIGTPKSGSPIGPGYRKDAATGVLDVLGLATSFAKALDMPLKGGEPTGTQSFTAAEFALEMVAGVDEVVFGLSG